MNVEGVGMQYGMQPSKPPKPEDLIADKDNDGDGALSAEEVDGMPEDKFSEIDTDGDGLLTQEELESDMEQMKKNMQDLAGGGGPGMMAQGVDPTQFVQQLISDKDSDGDGLLNQDEFGMSEKLFSKIDTDSDGLLRQEELETDVSNMQARGSAGGNNGSAGEGQTTSASASSASGSTASSTGTSSYEILGNGIDDDGDGETDEIDTDSDTEEDELV